MNPSSNISSAIRASWQVPDFELPLWQGRKRDFCIVIPVINEGERIQSLLRRMKELSIWQLADIIVVDGGSKDDSLHLPLLQDALVRGLLIKTGPGKLSAQLRCGYAFALDQGYEGIITIDGNNKDDPVAIFQFINSLAEGIDFVQASRFITGGSAENTPKIRDFAIRHIHAPLLTMASGFKWTDTTQGFRAYSRRMLLDADISAFRNTFETYELLAYLSYRAPRLGFKCVELPTIRRYPEGETPTKISGLRGYVSLLEILIRACLGYYNPTLPPTRDK
ncbi:glycosyltransferase family 2 protein [Achromobacter kerstersii]|uniref:glycosyltransferase family 2 protein n=1 Tax=Achromobacter kerstersii TaxID=1353890 RepID=UPI00313E71A9